MNNPLGPHPLEPYAEILTWVPIVLLTLLAICAILTPFGWISAYRQYRERRKFYKEGGKYFEKERRRKDTDPDDDLNFPPG